MGYELEITFLNENYKVFFYKKYGETNLKDAQ